MNITSRREFYFTSMSHYNLVHKFVPMPRAMKVPDATAGVDKKHGRSSKSCQRGNWPMQRTKRGHSGSTKREKNSPCCYADGHLSSQKCGVETEIQSTKAGLCSEVTLWRTIPARMQCAQSKVRRHRKWRPQKEWMSLQNYLIVQDKQPTQCPLTLKDGGAPKLLNIPRSECPYTYIYIYEYVFHDTSGQSHGQTLRSRGSSWARFVRTPTCRPLVGKTIWESSIGTRKGEYRIGSAFLFSEKQGLFFVSIRGWHHNGRKKAGWSWRADFISWPRVLRDALNVGANRTNIL